MSNEKKKSELLSTKSSTTQGFDKTRLEVYEREKYMGIFLKRSLLGIAILLPLLGIVSLPFMLAGLGILAATSFATVALGAVALIAFAATLALILSPKQDKNPCIVDIVNYCVPSRADQYWLVPYTLNPVDTNQLREIQDAFFHPDTTVKITEQTSEEGAKLVLMTKDGASKSYDIVSEDEFYLNDPEYDGAYLSVTR